MREGNEVTSIGMVEGSSVYVFPQEPEVRLQSVQRQKIRGIGRVAFSKVTGRTNDAQAQVAVMVVVMLSKSCCVKLKRANFRGSSEFETCSLKRRVIRLF